MNEEMNRFDYNTEGKICDYGYEEPKVLNEQEILEELNWVQNANDFFREENQILNYKNECLIEEIDKNEKIISKLSADLTVSEEVIEDLQRELALTKKELDKAIVPKFNIGQEVWFIDDINEETHLGIIVGFEVSKVYDSQLEVYYRIEYEDGCLTTDDFEDKLVFATEEEARAKLKELKK